MIELFLIASIIINVALFGWICGLYSIIHDLKEKNDNTQSAETYSFEQVQELVKLNQQFAQEIENLKRPKGRWIRYRDNPHQPEHIKCSNCGQYWSVADHDKIFDICFKCGADMRGLNNEN